MELKQAIAARRMVRALSPEPLGAGVLDVLLDLARRAPAAGNTAAVSFLVLDTPESVAAYWTTTLASPDTFRWQQLLDAPALVVVCTRPDAYAERYREPDKSRTGLGSADWPVPYWWVDAGAVAQNLLLLCVDAGLGACLFGLFDHEAAVRDRFGVPDGQRLVATIAIGRPLPDQPGRSAARGRPPLEQIIHRGSWNAAPPESR